MATQTAVDLDDDFLRHCPALLFVADQDGVAVQLSEPLARLLGPEVRRGTKLSERVHPDDRGAFDAAWAELAGSDKPTRFDVRLNETAGQVEMALALRPFLRRGHRALFSPLS